MSDAALAAWDRRVAEVEARLLAPGSPFALAEETVLGEPCTVFATRPRALGELLERSRAFGERDYLVFGERRLSYAEHLRRVAAVARGLRERHGVGPGDRVGILAGNAPEVAIAFWAAVSLGAVATVLNAWWTRGEIGPALALTEPRVLLVDERRAERLGAEPPGVRVLPLAAELAALARDFDGAGLPEVAVAEDDPAVILFTSGTTGRAKAAVSSHRNLLALLSVQAFHGARLFLLRGLAPPTAPPVMLSSNPMFHVSGLYTGVVSHLALGARSVWTEGRFDPAQVLALMEREQVTAWAPHGAMGPRVLAELEKRPRPLGSVLTLGSGGAPVPPALQAALVRAFPGAVGGMGVGYGLTEGTGLATLEYGEGLTLLPRSVGRPLPTVELAIRRADGSAAAEDEDGEICLRGPLSMLGYFRDAEATAAALRAGRWLHTGDIGRVAGGEPASLGGGVLAGGRLFMASRRGDLILRSAENIYPAEVELALGEHPAVAEVAVLGVPHAELGQEVMAVVVPRAGRDAPTPEQLRAFLGDRLAPYKVPSRWELRREPLPRNASGKVLKHRLGPAGAGEGAFVEE